MTGLYHTSELKSNLVVKRFYAELASSKTDNSKVVPDKYYSLYFYLGDGNYLILYHSDKLKKLFPWVSDEYKVGSVYNIPYAHNIIVLEGQ